MKHTRLVARPHLAVARLRVRTPVRARTVIPERNSGLVRRLMVGSITTTVAVLVRPPTTAVRKVTNRAVHAVYPRVTAGAIRQQILAETVTLCRRLSKRSLMGRGTLIGIRIMQMDGCSLSIMRPKIVRRDKRGPADVPVGVLGRTVLV